MTPHLTSRNRTLSLTLTMAALCCQAVAPLAYAQDATQPAPVMDADSGRRAALAEASYVDGMSHREAGRLTDAISSLTRAVDSAPNNEQYRKALRDTEAMAGLTRETRSTTIDRLADEMSVRQQELKAEAAAKVDQGLKAMESGDYPEAERLFLQAGVRLETLPYADASREPELRRAESLATEAKRRRDVQERELATRRSQDALDEQQKLRDLSLRIERDRIDAMLSRAQRARDRRDFDEAILLCEQILKINRAESRADSLLAKCRRERHSYLRQVTADRWDEEHKLLTEQIRTAMLPQLEIIQYSSDWPEIDRKRGANSSRGAAVREEPWRKEIDAKLEQEVSLNAQDMELSELVNYLHGVTGVTFILDPKVLAAAPPPITLNIAKMKLRFMLEHIKTVSGLSYDVRDEAIFISNAEGLRGDVYMVPYDVRDLTHAMQSFPGPELDIPQPGDTKGAKLLAPIQTAEAQDTNEFIEIIKKVVEPTSWEAENSGVSIQEYNGMMVVTHSASVHRRVEELLRSLRNQKGTQIHVKVKFLSVENSALEEIGVNWNQFAGPAIAAGSGVTPISPVPGSAGPLSFGAFLGNDYYNTNAAATVNNSSLNYTSANSLTRPSPGQGLSLSSQAWSLGNDLYARAVLNAVEKEKRGNVIYEPDLTMFNGQQAHLVNMNQQAYVADYDVVQNQFDPIVSVISYGTVLDVVAIASADKKYITMTLRPTNAQIREWRRYGNPVSNFPGGNINQSGDAIADGGDLNDINGGRIPNIFAGSAPLLIPSLDYQSVRTTATIPDGGSLVIAGMTNGESARSHAGVPFLSHIPFLGRLFSTNGRQETLRKQMIVVQADVVIFEEIEKSL